MQKKITEETKVSIKQYYNQGLSLAEVARRTKVPRTTVYNYTRGLEKAQSLGYDTYTAYRNHVIREKGYASWRAYMRGLESQHQQQQLYQESARMIMQALRRMNKTQKWLAEQLRVNKNAVTLYVQGKTLPNKEHRKKLCDVLQLDENRLENIVNNCVTEKM